MHRTAAVQLLKPEHVPQACDFLTLMINGKSQRVPALVLCEDEFMVLIDLRAEAIGNELGRTPAREAVVEGECWQREIWGLDGHDIFRACYELRQDLYRQVPVLPNPLVVAVVGFISCPLALLIGLKYASHQTQRRPMLPRPKLQTMACEGNRASVSVFRVHPSWLAHSLDLQESVTGKGSASRLGGYYKINRNQIFRSTYVLHQTGSDQDKGYVKSKGSENRNGTEQIHPPSCGDRHCRKRIELHAVPCSML
ncbi:hypothetical protein AXG93_2782s1100 [Marchantia polymorpha subsp. ruderalis]|uniref:Uncharacterized protein n=1 Tax=Marchantia polymorpha subsp. ruderalis TaxID=1480154 RepID=A0A176WT96_MARPO|nr:hypothetical protein AXG93_2782s1100 [Marchantia polymorpha subsp. ruderalis]